MTNVWLEDDNGKMRDMTEFVGSADKGYVYFARPIDFMNTTAQHTQFQSMVEQVLAESGYSIYHPAYAWNVNGPMTSDLARAIESTNRFAMRRAKAVIAWLPEGIPTQGVPMEIEFGTRQLGLPVIAIGAVGASVMSNPMVEVYRESEVEEVGKALDVLVPNYRARNNPTIRWSGPNPLVHAYSDDAGVDLTASRNVRLTPGEAKLIPTGIKVEIPHTMFGWIVARSSTWRNHGLQVLPGVIDAGYQGELFVNALNAGRSVATVVEGEKIGQLLLLANMWPGFHLVKTAEDQVHSTPTERGARGFGSSGR